MQVIKFSVHKFITRVQITLGAYNIILCRTIAMLMQDSLYEDSFGIEETELKIQEVKILPLLMFCLLGSATNCTTSHHITGKHT